MQRARLGTSRAVLVLVLGVTTVVSVSGQSPPPGFFYASGTAVGPAGTLGIQDGAFTVNGQKKFLLFFSYFGALRDAIKDPNTMVNIFNIAGATGYSGVRVFPNWWNDIVLPPSCPSFDPRPLIKAPFGAINFDPLSGGDVQPIPPGLDRGYHNSVAGRFQFLLDQAWEKGLVVDVSFAHETAGLMNDPFRAGVAEVARVLKGLSYTGNPQIPPQTGYPHVFFDLQNEFDHPTDCGKQAFSEEEIGSFRAQVKHQMTGDPARLVSASLGGQPSFAWPKIDEAGLNLVAYHDPREPYDAPQTATVEAFPWWFMTPFRLTGYHAQLNGQHVDYFGWRELTSSLPIYFTEPERHRYLPSGCDENSYDPPQDCANNYTDTNFFDAAKAAKQHGAASWTWHTKKLFRAANDTGASLTRVEATVGFGLPGQIRCIPWPQNPTLPPGC